jgi:hypothetical protein
MNNNPTFAPFVSHRKTKAIYKFKGGLEFENIVTGNKGEVTEETANKVFFMEPELSQLCNEYPLVESLIKALDLKISK